MNFHHNANLMPFLIISAAFTITHFRIPHKPVIILLLILLFFGSLNPRAIIWSVFQKDFADTKTYDYINKSLAMIPNSAKVSAGSSIVPHLSNREKIYMFPEIYDASYIILDPTLSNYPLESKDLWEKINSLKQSPSWQIEKEIKTLIIFKKRLNSP